MKRYKVKYTITQSVHILNNKKNCYNVWYEYVDQAAPDFSMNNPDAAVLNSTLHGGNRVNHMAFHAQGSSKSGLNSSIR